MKDALRFFGTKDTQKLAAMLEEANIVGADADSCIRSFGHGLSGFYSQDAAAKLGVDKVRVGDLKGLTDCFREARSKFGADRFSELAVAAFGSDGMRAALVLSL